MRRKKGREEGKNIAFDDQMEEGNREKQTQERAANPSYLNTSQSDFIFKRFKGNYVNTLD